MSAREEILAKVRSAVSGDTKQAARQEAVLERIKTHPVGVLPQEEKSPSQLVDLFVTKVEAAAASIVSCNVHEVEAEILKFMREHNLPSALRMGDDPRLTKFGIGSNDMLEVSTGPSEGQDEVTVSHAFGGAAETGTLALVSGKENPTTLNFLASNHIVVLDRHDLKLHQEEIWEALRQQYGNGNMPRTFNFITGPSRSADIEQTLILGAHGPLRLHILLVGD